MSSRAADRQMDRLIELMARNATVVVSGAKMAEHIGVTRSTIWRWVERLRALGVEIQGHNGVGYQLKKIPDVVLASQVRPHFGPDQIGHRVLHSFSIDSTNDLAMKLAGQGCPHGTVVLAEEQTAGRGRFGRSWYSEKFSGIYVSVVLRPPFSPAMAPILSLMAGLAAREAIESVTGLRADIRWPNDLLIGRKKVCGILTQMNAELDRLHFAVLGIGMNVNHRRMPAKLAQIATSLRLEGRREYSRLAILIALLRALERDYRRWVETGPARLVERCEQASSYARGKRVIVKRGSEEFVAVTVGFDPTGALRVRRKQGEEESLLSAEITEVK